MPDPSDADLEAMERAYERDEEEKRREEAEALMEHDLTEEDGCTT